MSEFRDKIMPDTELLYYLYNRFAPYTLSYVYKGVFNPNLTDKILALAETNMNLLGEVSKTQKKVYFVMVESLQNITRHQDVGQDADNQAFFLLQNKNGKYGLASGNVIENEHIALVKERIDIINSFNTEELKEHYKKVLQTTELSDKGGAGLGLIEMARRSGNKLSYAFKPFNANQSFFYFKSKVSSTESESESEHNLQGVKELHDFAQAYHINMVYQGVFTHENLKSLLSMSEGSVENSKLPVKKRVANIIIELLQNICNHGASLLPDTPGIPGILMVCGVAEGIKILSGNFIISENAESLTNKINIINQSSNEQLETMYAEIIMKEDLEGQKGAGLGFIDMRMKGADKINYSVVAYNEKFSFLAISILVPF